MRCPDCGREMTRRLGEHLYIESGLDNVRLSDVELWSCECGATAVGIPAVPELHTMIGQHLLRKPALLSGAEIRFLRKNMGYSSKGFAELLGIDKATVSRWENDKQAPDRPTDRLIRLVYASNKGIALHHLLEHFPGISGDQAASPEFCLPRSAWSFGANEAQTCSG